MWPAVTRRLPSNLCRLYRSLEGSRARVDASDPHLPRSTVIPSLRTSVFSKCVPITDPPVLGELALVQVPFGIRPGSMPRWRTKWIPRSMTADARAPDNGRG